MYNTSHLDLASRSQKSTFSVSLYGHYYYDRYWSANDETSVFSRNNPCSPIFVKYIEFVCVSSEFIPYKIGRNKLT